MVLESLSNPFDAENKPWRMAFLGFLYASVASFLGLLIFEKYASLVMVFLTSLACVPLIYNTIRYEEEKDLQDLEEKALLKEHSKALKVFMMLFLGITLACALWYVVLPATNISNLFNVQVDTINNINANVVGNSVKLDLFTKIFMNNVRVLIFCILFSFLYGAGAIFVLSWNASVIGTAIGNFIRTNLIAASEMIGWEKIGNYFHVVSIGLMKYVIHGIPEILAYFVAALAGGIISVAIIKHDWKTRRFEHIILDSSDLLLLAIGILFIAGVLEVWVTPLFF